VQTTYYTADTSVARVTSDCGKTRAELELGTPHGTSVGSPGLEHLNNR
jgi:hypothetical protein